LRRSLIPKRYGISQLNRGAGFFVEFEIYPDGTWWCARGIGADIFTQGETIQALFENIMEAVLLHFEDVPEGGR
jgi:predicted RNase H-like HicB family nuclease